MSEYQYLKITREDGLVECAMHNPPEQVLNHAMLGEINHLLTQIEQDDSIRVFMLTGTDNVFLKWFDLGEISESANTDLKQETDPGLISVIHRLSLRFQKLQAVTIAAINGMVGGGGCELSLSFDFRLMADGEGITFALPQTSFGLVPGGGGAYHCIRLLGRAKALDVLLHGDFMSPTQALDLGLISRLYPIANFQEEKMAFARKMAARAPLALRGVKNLVNNIYTQGQLDFYVAEGQELLKTINSEDAKHALATWISNPDPLAYAPEFKGK